MIPKIIHYCWFGGNEMPPSYKEFIGEWKLLHPDWTIIKWDEQNSPMDSAYIQNAIRLGNWANISNLIRLYALNQYGGIYLDTDMKLVKPLDELLGYNCFLGFEHGSEEDTVFWLNNAAMGAVKNHPFVQECLSHLLENFDGSERANLSSPHLVTNLLKEQYQLTAYGRQLKGDIMLFEKEVFYPVSYDQAYLVQQDIPMPEQTIAIHTWGRTWFTHDMMIDIIDDLQKAYRESRALKDQYASELSASQEKIVLLSERLSSVQKEHEELSERYQQQSEIFSGLERQLEGAFQSLRERAEASAHRINEHLTLSKEIYQQVESLTVKVGQGEVRSEANIKEFKEIIQSTTKQLESVFNSNLKGVVDNFKACLEDMQDKAGKGFRYIEGKLDAIKEDAIKAHIKLQEGIGVGKAVHQYVENLDRKVELLHEKSKAGQEEVISKIQASLDVVRDSAERNLSIAVDEIHVSMEQMKVATEKNNSVLEEVSDRQNQMQEKLEAELKFLKQDFQVSLDHLIAINEKQQETISFYKERFDDKNILQLIYSKLFRITYKESKSNHVN